MIRATPLPAVLRHRLRSSAVVLGVFAVVGAAYELVTAGVLTAWGPGLGLCLGLPLVVFEVLVPTPLGRRWPFAAGVLAKALVYAALIALVFLGSLLVYGLGHGLGARDFYAAAWSAETATKVGVGFGAFAVVLFFRRLDRLLGPGTLVRYVFGRYHRPRREERIFLFLDLKGSTALAERMDPEAYYGLLDDFFHDVAGPVLATGGEVYQYVGDEVVLTWPMARGLRDAGCVRAFFEIDAAVQRHEPRYLDRYGVVPEYKGGLHGGDVLRAEIGDLKRDLVYSGDVLNTTARIQAECNRLGARLLVSAALRERLVLPPDVEAEALGAVELRGKRDAVGLVRLTAAPVASPERRGALRTAASH